MHSSARAWNRPLQHNPMEPQRQMYPFFFPSLFEQANFDEVDFFSAFTLSSTVLCLAGFGNLPGDMVRVDRIACVILMPFC